MKELLSRERDGTAARASWACPLCLTVLEDNRCADCGRVYPVSAAGQADFRLAQPITITYTYRYEPTFGRFPWDRVTLDWPNAQTGLAADSNWELVERYMLRVLPRAKAGEIALDVGCGENRQRFRDGLAQLGYTPVGIDIDGPSPDALADAHRLPLLDSSVDVVMTSAVFEHLKNPHIAMSEIARVVRPGGLVVGSIAFGEPFHISYFHHSPLAVFDLLDSSGLEGDVFVLPYQYSALYAHLDMGYAGLRIPRMLHRPLADLLHQMLIFPARIKGLAMRSPGHVRDAKIAFARSHAASVGFVAHRPR